MTPRTSQDPAGTASPRNRPAVEPSVPPAPAAAEGDRSPSSLPLLEAAVAEGSPDIRRPAAPEEGCSQAAGTSPVAAAMSENELEQHMRRILAGLPSVLAYHTHDSRHSPSGFPDWVFAGPQGVLFRELKREGKRPTPAQAEWLTALVRAGQDACVWRPSDLLTGRIARKLAAIAGLLPPSPSHACGDCQEPCSRDGASEHLCGNTGCLSLHFPPPGGEAG